MLELLGCLFIVDMFAIAWINFEMHLADLGPIYDENYQPIG